MPPIAPTRFAKLCCSESTLELEPVDPEPAVPLAVAVELLPLTSEMRLCSAELNGPPPKPPAGVAAAAVPEVLSAVVAAVPPLLLPEPVTCACSASTRF